MLRTKPKTKYCGLTIVLSRPSRFDTLNLLSAGAGVFFNKECLQPHYSIMQCDIRLMDDISPWLPDTKCIVLCGEQAMHKYCNDTHSNTLNEMRGSPLYVDGTIPAIATFNPQEAADIKDYENTLNKGTEDSYETDEEDADESAIKSHSVTRRANYAFWVKSDIAKCKKLLASGTNKWPTEEQPVYRIYPSSEEVISSLESYANYEYMDFDIETDIEEQNLQCFSYTFDGKTIYSVPVLDYNYQLAYSALPRIMRSLGKAMYNTTVVAHNGAEFDFLVFGFKYRMPVNRVFDTRIAMHRCFPEVETSLGHCISYWTYQRFHKDTDSAGYQTHPQMMARLKYCAKDVFTMNLVRRKIQEYARTIPGLEDSIRIGNDSIIPYLTTTLQGIRYSEKERQKVINENDQRMMQYNRIIHMLVGPIGMKVAQASVKKASGFFANSTRQCVNYFHEQLEYPPIKTSKETGEPLLGKGQLYNLQLKHDNPVIRFITLFRLLRKETSDLQFNPWIGDDGKVLPRRKPILDE